MPTKVSDNEKSAAQEGIHELLAERWSPREFEARPVEPSKLVQLFEAARWAPSSYNAQPWSFIVATRENAEAYNRLLSTLMDANQKWAKQAPVLILAVTRLNYTHVDHPNRHAYYDLGQAVANLTVQATALGLRLHQMGGFDPQAARELFAIPAGHEAVSVLALGYQPGQPADLAARTRKPLAEFVFDGSWGRAAKILA